MNITKRDIADIVLVVTAISFMLALSRSILSLGAYFGLPADEFQMSSVPFYVAQLLSLLFLNYVLLFKRSIVLSIVFPEARDKEVSVPEGLTPLTSYSFWIKLFGLFILLKSTVSFVSVLISDLISSSQFTNALDSMTMMMRGMQFTLPLVSLILAAIIIWKSDWIAEKFENIKSSNQSSEPT